MFAVKVSFSGKGSSSGKAHGYGLGGRGSVSSVAGMEIFLHSYASRLVLWSTQPPVILVPEISPAVKTAEHRT